MDGSCSDVFSNGIWPEIGQIHDPNLKELAESLPMVALRSKAPATVKKYAGGFNRWKRWADSKPGIDPFPACFVFGLPGSISQD